MPEPCCNRDHDGDGNCDRHPERHEGCARRGGVCDCDGAGKPCALGGVPRTPLAWEQKAEHWWHAEGVTTWDIIRLGSEGPWGQWGVVIANWDRPDYWCASLEDAKRLAEEHDAAPPYTGPPIIDVVSDW